MSAEPFNDWSERDDALSDPPTHVLDVKLHESDYEEHFRDQFLNDPDTVVEMSGRKREGIRGLICFSIIAAGSSLIAYRLIQHEIGTIEIVTALAIAGYSFWAIAMYIRGLRYFNPESRQFDLWAQSAGRLNAQRSGGSQFRLIIRSDRIGAVYRAQRSEWRWTEVEHIAQTQQATLIALQHVGTLIVPNRCLPSGLTPAEFVRSLREFKSASDRESSRAGSTEFALTDVACPSCKYMVSPLSQNICPECGTRMSAESFRVR